MNKAVGYHWIYRDQISESVNMLVFTSNNKVIRYCDYPRGDGDFANSLQKDNFTREEAVFEVKEVDDWLQFYQYF